MLPVCMSLVQADAKSNVVILPIEAREGPALAFNRNPLPSLTLSQGLCTADFIGG